MADQLFAISAWILTYFPAAALVAFCTAYFCLNERQRDNIRDWFGRKDKAPSVKVELKAAVTHVDPPPRKSLDECYAELISVKPAIIPRGSITGGMGYNPWKNVLRKKVVQLVEWHRWKHGRFPCGAFIIETGDISKLGPSYAHGGEIFFRNLVKFPNEVPPLAANRKGFSETLPLSCDASLNYFDNIKSNGDSLTGARRLVLRTPIFLGRYDWTIRDLSQISQVLGLTPAEDDRLTECTIRFADKHGYPPNLVMIYHELSGDHDSEGLCEAIRALHWLAEGDPTSTRPSRRLPEVTVEDPTKTLKTKDGFYVTSIILPDADRWWAILSKHQKASASPAPINSLLSRIPPGAEQVEFACYQKK